MSWQEYAEKRLGEIEAGLGRESWGGRWPSAQTVQAARTAAQRAFPETALPPSVCPTEDGEISFVWLLGGWAVTVSCLEGCQSLLDALCGPDPSRDLHGTLSTMQEQFTALMAEITPSQEPAP